MGLPKDINARRFYRVALQRLDDGELILERLGRTNAAVYLAGYAIECILKALLLQSTPQSQREPTLSEFVGRRGHDLEWLRARLKGRGISVPDTIRNGFAYVSTWSTNMRYDPASFDERDARRFMAATQAIVEWAERRC